MSTHMFTSIHTKTFHILYCSLEALRVFVGKCTVNLKRAQFKIRLIADNHYVYIHRIVWDLSASVVIVCILWVVFFSGRLDGADYY